MRSLRVILLILSALLLCPFGHYYHIDTNVVTQNHSEHNCNQKGRYLASVHTESQVSNINNIALPANITCWIGLYIQFDKLNNDTLLYWNDQTKIDNHLINQYWCKGYPFLHHIPSNDLYYVYIAIDNDSSTCWKSVSSLSSLTMYGICGPKMFDTTGYLWICQTIIPSILMIIGLIYSIYCARFLRYHLFYFEHNWIDSKLQPTTAIKITAMLAPIFLCIISILVFTHAIMLYAAYRISGLIFPYSPFESNYPPIFSQIGCIAVAMVILFLFYQPIGYIHILLRLKHVFDNNSIMKDNVLSSRQHMVYYCIAAMISIYFILPFIYEIVINSKVFTNMINERWIFGIIIAGIWILLDMAINSVLLFLYIKGLHKYSHIQYFRLRQMKNNLNSPLIDTRQHELMLEATRYTVLFSMVLIFNIFTLLVMIGTYVMFKKYLFDAQGKGLNDEYHEFNYIPGNIFIVCWYGKEILFLTAIQLSFKFSHIRYEKVCAQCDKRIKEYCQNIVKRKNDNIVREYELQSAQRDMLQIPLL